MPCKKKNKKKKKRPHTPIVSKKQFKAMAATRAAQEGKIPASSLYGASAEMFESMKKSGPKSPKAHMQEKAGKKYKSLPVEVSRKKYVSGRKKQKAKRILR